MSDLEQTYASRLRALASQLHTEAAAAEDHGLYGLADALRTAQGSALAWSCGFVGQDREVVG